MDTKMVRSAFITATLVCCLQTPRVAVGGAAIGATEPTQLLNNIQLIISYIEQVTTAAENVEQRIVQAENIVRQGLAPIYDVKAKLDDVRDVVKDGLSLAYSVQNLDQVFTDRYKDFDDFIAGNYDRLTFSEDLRNWTQTTEDSIKSALTAAGVQLESLDEEDAIMRQLHAKAESGGRGHQKALDVANEISVMAAQQMQSLRQLVATDMQIKAAYFQQETAIRQASEAASAEFFSPQLLPLGGATPDPTNGADYSFGPGQMGDQTRVW